jgi:Zn-dependent protease with chaperone function
MSLTTPRETSLLNLNFLLAGMFWLVIILITFGGAILFAGLAFLFFLFSQSVLVSHIKGNGVRISANQFPDIHKKLVDACGKLSMQVPEAYVINGNGILNAFATVFLSHKFVVLNSDVVDSFTENGGPLDFYLGHELGHLHRGHVQLWPFFAPLFALPFLMPAYRRACELTCDQYGAFCCASPQDAVFGLSLLAAGKTRWKSVSFPDFMQQNQATGEFWMTLNEVVNHYPWLSKRVALVSGDNSKVTFPPRHSLALLVAFFCPGFLPANFIPFYFGYIALLLMGMPRLFSRY